MRTATRDTSTRAHRRGTVRPFHIAASLTLDAIISELERDDPAPNPLRRAWLRLQKRVIEARFVPASVPPPRAVEQLGIEEAAAGTRFKLKTSPTSSRSDRSG